MQRQASTLRPNPASILGVDSRADERPSKRDLAQVVEYRYAEVGKPRFRDRHANVYGRELPRARSKTKPVSAALCPDPAIVHTRGWVDRIARQNAAKRHLPKPVEYRIVKRVKMFVRVARRWHIARSRHEL